MTYTEECKSAAGSDSDAAESPAIAAEEEPGEPEERPEAHRVLEVQVLEVLDPEVRVRSQGVDPEVQVLEVLVPEVRVRSQGEVPEVQARLLGSPALA